MTLMGDFTQYMIDAGENDGDIYRSQGRPIVLNLARKKIRGIYDAKLALKLYMYMSETIIKKHKHVFCEYYEIPQSAVSRIPAGTKEKIAKALLCDYLPEINYAVKELREAAAKKKKLAGRKR